MERILELKFLRSARLLLAHASELNGMALADEPFSDLAALGLPQRWVATGTDSVDRRVAQRGAAHQAGCRARALRTTSSSPRK